MISGEHLRVIRTLKGIKQEVVAKRLCISQPAYSKMERAKKINPKKLGRILEAIECNDADLKKFSILFTESQTG